MGGANLREATIGGRRQYHRLITQLELFCILFYKYQGLIHLAIYLIIDIATSNILPTCCKTPNVYLQFIHTIAMETGSHPHQLFASSLFYIVCVFSVDPFSTWTNYYCNKFGIGSAF